MASRTRIAKRSSPHCCTRLTSRANAPTFNARSAAGWAAGESSDLGLSMDDHVVLRRVTLRRKHRPTGKTVHHRDGMELPAASKLEIVKYPDDDGFYLFYFDDAGKQL